MVAQADATSNVARQFLNTLLYVPIKLGRGKTGPRKKLLCNIVYMGLNNKTT